MGFIHWAVNLLKTLISEDLMENPLDADPEALLAALIRPLADE